MKVRIDSVIQSQAELIAVAIDWVGRRQVLGVELLIGKAARPLSQLFVRQREFGATSASADKAPPAATFVPVVVEPGHQRVRLQSQCTHPSRRTITAAA